MAFKVTLEYDGTPSRSIEIMTEGVHGALGNIADELLKRGGPLVAKVTIDPNFDPADWVGQNVDPIVRDPAR